jgi:uncharacterized membrane protein
MKRRTSSIAFVSILLLFWSAAISPAAATPVKADAVGVITIPISDLSATARHYEFSNGTTTIRFFAVLGSDKTPRVAFDACEVCGGRLGYEQHGTDIQCRTCGRVFRIDDIGSKNRSFGCWPSYLAHRTKGANIVIDSMDVKNGKALFQ